MTKPKKTIRINRSISIIFPRETDKLWEVSNGDNRCKKYSLLEIVDMMKDVLSNEFCLSSMEIEDDYRIYEVPRHVRADILYCLRRQEEKVLKQKS